MILIAAYVDIASKYCNSTATVCLCLSQNVTEESEYLELLEVSFESLTLDLN